MPIDNCTDNIYGPVGSNPGQQTDQGGGEINGSGTGASSGNGGGGSPGGFNTGISVASDWSSVSNRARMQLVYQGDLMMGRFSLSVDGAPVDPAKNRVTFTLADERLKAPIWVGVPGDGVTVLAGEVIVEIPQAIADNLRRGGFLYSIAVSDPYGRRRRTVYEGRLLVEYAANATNPDIPYRNEPNIDQTNQSLNLPPYP